MTPNTITILETVDRSAIPVSHHFMSENSPWLNAIQLIFIVFTYFIAAIPFGVLVSRLVSGKDVRSQGSGNIGATNVARMMGKKWGITVLFLDALKGFIVVGLAKHVGPLWYCNFIAVLAVTAHCYPVYLKFKGGKGVATAIGVFAALSWPLAGLCILTFAITVGISRKISLGSLMGALSIVPLSFFPGFNLTPWAAVILVALVWWKHQENIKRLRKGSEPKFF